MRKNRFRWGNDDSKNESEFDYQWKPQKTNRDILYRRIYIFSMIAIGIISTVFMII